MKAVKMAVGYVKNPKNKDIHDKLRKVTLSYIEQMVTSTNEVLTENDLPVYDFDKLSNALQDEFNDIGLHGKNEIYQSTSLNKIRKATDKACEGVNNAPDVIEHNGNYFFQCLNNKVGCVAKTKLIVKGATAGDFFQDSEKPSRKLTWDEISTADFIASPEENLKPKQATTKK